jgi:peroxin-6
VYSHIFSTCDEAQSARRKPLILTITNPLPLTEVVLTAFSEDAFRSASTQDAIFENWLFADNLILRQGDVHTFSTELPCQNGLNTVGVRTFRYRVDMMEPVQQGYAQKHTTRFVVTLAEDSDRTIATPRELGSTPDDGSENESEGIEIDEGFLAGSVLPSTSEPLRREIRNHAKDPSTYLEVGFHPLPLLQPTFSQDDCTVYLRTADLGRVGVLNGDWVSIWLILPMNHNDGTAQGVVRSSDILRYRLVRMVADDDLVPTT